MTGIEPAWPAWKAGALPLSYIRIDRGPVNYTSDTEGYTVSVEVIS